ncbi:MAG: hypothetical protein GZ087_04120 [Flavobacterium sp.]|nr:hypothetical protein [Flavobacterium sp.]
MKTFLRNFRFLSLIILLLILSNCQVEENSVIKNTSLKYNIKNLTQNEIATNLKIVENINALSKNKNNAIGKTIPYNELGFTIRTDFAKYIEKGEYNSYTFSTVQKYSENIKNVLFSKNENGEYDAFLVEYNYNKQELLNSSPDKLIEKTKITPININLKKSSTAKIKIMAPIWVCKYEYEYIDTGDLRGSGNEQYEWVLKFSECVVINADVIESSNTTSGSGTTTYTTSGSFTNSGGSGGSIATTPTPSMYDDDELVKISVVKTKLNTGGQQSRFLDQNGQIAFEVYDYITNEMFSSESITFSKEIINQMILNPGLYFNINSSSKSPSNIDLSKVTPSPIDPSETNHDLKIKFKCIFDKLIQSPKFKELFLDMFGENKRLNVIFDIANVENNRSGKTVTNQTNPLNNTITIDTDILASGDNMSIVKTIIHECIHAYLNLKLCDPSIGMSIPTLANMDVYSCINEYYNDFSSGQNQHNFIYNMMLPTMETILSQVKDLLVDPTNNAAMLDLNMRIPFDTSPATPFNWNDYYHNLSLSGLQDCSFFKSEIGTLNENGTVIITTIDQTKMQSYNQYNTRGKANITHNCNP